MILISTHAVFDESDQPRHGTGTELTTYLQSNKQSYCYIKHALSGESKTEVEIYKNNQKKLIIKRVGISGLPLLLRVIQDQVINFYYAIKFKNIKLYIGIDPLNAFSAVISKKLNLVKSNIFYTADYAHERFVNKVMNNIYHALDLFAAKNSDQVWNVSSRIVQAREKQGIDSKIIFLIPNTPEFRKTRRLPLSKINKHDLVIVSNLTRAIDYPLMIKAVSLLEKKYKDIKLKIIGSGEYQPELEKLVSKLKLEDKIIFLGRKPHKEVLDILSKSAIGVAIYTKDKPWTHFGDSMKVREYMACGLPVIMNDIASTADDVNRYKAGIVLKGKGKGFEKAVDEIFSSKQVYQQYRKNAVELAKKYDFTKSVDYAFAKIA